MLDLDSPGLRDMLAKRLYELDPLYSGPTGQVETLAWDDARVRVAREASYAEVDFALNALRSLASDGLLVRG
jgi:hypothetical protein